MRYKVVMKEETYYFAIVEAANEDQARDQVNLMESPDFEYLDSGDFEIVAIQVEPLTEISQQKLF